MPKDQLQLAEQLLKNKTAPFDPLLFKDRYQDSLLEVIKAKTKTKAGLLSSGELTLNHMEFAHR